VNIRIHRILLSVAILGVFSVYGKAQQKINILHVHFQVRHFTDSILKADANNESFAVTYRVECNRPPCKFHGFQLNLVFDKIKLAPNGGSAYYDGSASANASLKQSAYSASTGTFNVFVDEPLPGMLDTSNHLLFSYTTTVRLSEGDSALVEPAVFDVLKSADSNINSNIDTVIIDNASGRFSDGTWYPFAIAFLDSTPVTKKTYPVTLACDFVEIKSDSVARFPLLIESADSAIIKNASIRLLFDTSLIEIKNIAPGPMLAAATLTSGITGDTLNMSINSTAALHGTDTAVFLTVHAKPRHDTLCVSFDKPMMTVTNSDNAVAQIFYSLAPICVFGKKQDTTGRGVRQSKTTSFIVQLLADGRTLSVRSSSESDLTNKRMLIFSETGALVQEARLSGTQMQILTELPSAVYVAVIIAANGESEYRQQFSVIH
jgi:hypothetical protein